MESYEVGQLILAILDPTQHETHNIRLARSRVTDHFLGRHSDKGGTYQGSSDAESCSRRNSPEFEWTGYDLMSR